MFLAGFSHSQSRLVRHVFEFFQRYFLLPPKLKRTIFVCANQHFENLNSNSNSFFGASVYILSYNTCIIQCQMSTNSYPDDYEGNNDDKIPYNLNRLCVRIDLCSYGFVFAYICVRRYVCVRIGLCSYRCSLNTLPSGSGQAT